MAFDYSSLKQTANRLIERFGQTAVLEKPGEGYVGRGRDRRPAAFTRHDVTVVDKGVVAEAMPGGDGTSVVERSRQIVMSVAARVVPETRDVLLIGGERLTVVDAEAASPSGDTIVYKLKVEA